ncbi:hypothetical protein BH11PLA1_BH11PLA1_09140 [soil metagenome]
MEICFHIAPFATDTDVFTAVAEPRRRELIGALAKGERTVSQIVATLKVPQPQVSKHLGVLRSVGLVNVRRHGRERIYSINAPRLKTIHDWISMYEQLWDSQLARIKQLAERAAMAAKPGAASTPVVPPVLPLSPRKGASQ